MNYGDYITKSIIWKKKREARLKIDNYECRICGKNSSEVQLEVHHKRYPELGTESVENDLTSLCKNCHEINTDNIRRHRYGNKCLPKLVPISDLIPYRKQILKIKNELILVPVLNSLPK